MQSSGEQTIKKQKQNKKKHVAHIELFWKRRIILGKEIPSTRSSTILVWGTYDIDHKWIILIFELRLSRRRMKLHIFVHDMGLRTR